MISKKVLIFKKIYSNAHFKLNLDLFFFFMSLLNLIQ